MKKQHLLLLALGAGFLVLLFFQAGQTPTAVQSIAPVATEHGVPYWLYGIAAASVVAAVWLGEKRRLLSLLATVALILFIIAVYTSYRDGWLDDEYRDTFYVMASAAAILAEKYAVTGREKWGAGIGIGFLFLMLGFNGWGTPWVKFSSWFPWSGEWGSKQVIASAPSPQVGVTLVATLNANPVELKPSDKNIWWHELNPSECLKMYAAEDNRYLGNDCNGTRLDLKDVRRAKFASANGQPMIIQYGLVDP